MEKHGAQHRAAEAARCRRKSIEGTHKGLSACRKLLLPPQEVQKAQRGDAQLGSPRYSKPHLPAFTRFAPLSSFKSAAGERRSSAACYFSACLAPKTAWRRAPFNHLPRNLPPSSLLSAEGLGRPEPGSLRAPLLACSLASSPAAPAAPAIMGRSCHEKQNAPEQRKQFSRCYRGYVECFVPARALSPCVARRAQKGCANTGGKAGARRAQPSQTNVLS